MPVCLPHCFAYADKEEEQTAWKALRSLPGVRCCWDEYFDPFGTPLKSEELMPVTSNKMRGPLSDQPKKIGEHVYHTVDHIFCSDQVCARHEITRTLDAM